MVDVRRVQASDRIWGQKARAEATRDEDQAEVIWLDASEMVGKSGSVGRSWPKLACAGFSGDRPVVVECLRH